MAKNRIWNAISFWLTSVLAKIVVHNSLLEPISKLKQYKEVIRNRHPDCFL